MPPGPLARQENLGVNGVLGSARGSGLSRLGLGSAIRQRAEQRFWTLALFRRYWRHIDALSVVRCRRYLVREAKGRLAADGLLTLNLKSPMPASIALREEGSDFCTFDDVFPNEVYRNVLEHVRDCRAVLDLGAHIGLASLYFAGQYAASRLLSVEPHPENFKLLEANLGIIVQQGRCRTLRAAVWHRNAVLKPVPGLAPRRQASFAFEEANGHPEGDVVVAGWTMSQIIEYSGFQTVDLVKVDIEGAERYLFSGHLGWLKRVAAIAIEFHGRAREECAFDRAMADHGFVVAASGKHTLVAVKR